MTAGKVTIDGKDVRDLTLKSLRNQIGMVQQDVYLFDGTIRENIAYGKPDATDEEIVRAAVAAEIHDDIMKMPDGYDTIVGERGITLSGGQKQRVAIARALAMNPDIMLFDEPTSALDPELTGEVLKTIQQLADENMTMAIVTHEMAFAKSVSDKVLFMVDGKVEEEGTSTQIFENPQSERTRSFLQSILR